MLVDVSFLSLLTTPDPPNRAASCTPAFMEPVRLGIDQRLDKFPGARATWPAWATRGNVKQSEPEAAWGRDVSGKQPSGSNPRGHQPTCIGLALFLHGISKLALAVAYRPNETWFLTQALVLIAHVPIPRTGRACSPTEGHFTLEPRV
ncbi:unnamed protein product, partial [Protopolystoma xenopodis]